MAYSGNRRSNPLLIIAAVGLFLFGLAALSLSFINRNRTLRPKIDAELAERGYQDLYSTRVEPTDVQWIVVATANLNAGDEILPEFVELRSTSAVLSENPELGPAPELGDKPPELTGFLEELNDAAGQYAALDIPTGTPLQPSMVMEVNPFATALDKIRTDRITIAMPEEPTLYQLLRPGDRVDIMLVAGEETALRAMRDVRVVAVSNLLVKGSGLISAEQEARVGAQQQASRRKAAQIKAQAAQQAATQAPEEEPPAEEETPAEEPATEDDATGAEEEEVPEGTLKAGREFDGRTVTLQVTRQEAMTLAMTHTAAGVRLAFALHPRP